MTAKEKADTISLVVQLTLAKLEIVKLKADHYGWAHLMDDGRKMLDESLSDINKLLKDLKSNKN